MLSKSPLIQNTAFHASSSWQKMFYNELKSVILKRYWIASPGKIERPQRNEVHKEWPFQPWTTCSWDMTTLLRCNWAPWVGGTSTWTTHWSKSVGYSATDSNKEDESDQLPNTDGTRCTWGENQTCRSTGHSVMQRTTLHASCSPRAVHSGFKGVLQKC